MKKLTYSNSDIPIERGDKVSFDIGYSGYRGKVISLAGGAIGIKCSSGGIYHRTRNEILLISKSKPKRPSIFKLIYDRIYRWLEEIDPYDDFV